MRLLPALALGLCLAWPSHAVIIDSETGTGNTSAPADDPGWAHVGIRAGATAIYLGNGWVLTANHVGIGNVVLEGDTYAAMAGSYIQLENDSGSPPDLAVFRINSSPGLSILPIRASTPSTGAAVTMIGQGRNRGDATTWNGHHGYNWLSSKSVRWGINEVGDSSVYPLWCSTLVFNTECFYTDFSDTGGSTDEAQAANGDSGGAVFVKDQGVWELAGVMFAIGLYEDPDQPGDIALYGNLTFAADLAAYRDQIIELTRPECSDEIDNDGDELIDFPSDPDCHSLEGQSEHPTGLPGLSTSGLALLAALLAVTPLWMARRRRLGRL